MHKAMTGKESGDPMPWISTRLLFYTLEYVLRFRKGLLAETEIQTQRSPEKRPQQSEKTQITLQKGERGRIREQKGEERGSQNGRSVSKTGKAPVEGGRSADPGGLDHAGSCCTASGTSRLFANPEGCVKLRSAEEAIRKLE